MSVASILTTRHKNNEILIISSSHNSHNSPCDGLKSGVHDGKRWFICINNFLTGPVIVSNKNWNIPIKLVVVIAF